MEGSGKAKKKQVKTVLTPNIARTDREWGKVPTQEWHSMPKAPCHLVTWTSLTCFIFSCV